MAANEKCPPRQLSLIVPQPGAVAPPGRLVGQPLGVPSSAAAFTGR